MLVTDLMGLALATRPVASFWNEMGLVHGYDELNYNRGGDHNKPPCVSPSSPSSWGIE